MKHIKPQSCRINLYACLVITVTLFAFLSNAVRVAATPSAQEAPTNISPKLLSNQAMEEVMATINGILAESGLGVPEKQQKVLTFIRNFRYGPDNRHYFWATDTSGLMLANPYNSELEGKNQLGLRDQNGKRFISEVVQVAKDQGEGVVDYLWPRPGGEAPVLTVALIRLFKEWNWIIGTGSYPESIEAYEPPSTPRFYTPLISEPPIIQRPASPI